MMDLGEFTLIVPNLIVMRATVTVVTMVELMMVENQKLIVVMGIVINQLIIMKIHGLAPKIVENLQLILVKEIVVVMPDIVGAMNHVQISVIVVLIMMNSVVDPLL